MVEMALPLGNSLRLATIIEVDKTYVWCRYLGKFPENPFQCTIPHPYAGKKGGIFTGVEKDSIVLVAEGPGEQRFIVAFIPTRNQFFDQEGVDDVSFDTTPYPELEEGQISLRSAGTGSYIDIHPDGDIVLDAGAGEIGPDLELSGDTKSLIIRTENRYNFTEAGRVIEGIVKRDKNLSENSVDTKSINFLSGEGYDRFLKTIGRLPQYRISTSTTKIGSDFVRNPPLIERRSVLYEYADSFKLGKLSSEIKASTPVSKKETLDYSPGHRQNRRTDVLNLNAINYNHLIEKVEGTLVDIYGNILDINRNTIDIPDLDDLDFSRNVSGALKTIYRHMRRSVKYHFEINSRKELDDDEPSRSNADNRDHSRFSVDIDGEGLTKINIPSTSNTGNIPVLGRYFTSRSSEENDDDKDSKNYKESGSYRDPKQKDIRVSSFSVDGPTINNSSYVPETIDGGSVTAGTAYHDIMNVANALFSNGIWVTPPNVVSTSINNKMNDSGANAGGRSVHANLDGSAEISIGADNVDHKSLVMDLEGGVVSHYGADNNGRSIIHQSDGTVLVQIGGDSGPGRLEIHLANGSQSSSKIIIDEMGMTFDIQGNIVFHSTGSIGISADAAMMINGTIVTAYGSADATTPARVVSPGTTAILPTGLPHMIL